MFLPEIPCTIPLAGSGGLYGCEILRIPHCLGIGLIDGGKVVSLTHQPRCTPQKHFFGFGTHRGSVNPGPSAAVRIRYIEKIHSLNRVSKP
jgi:hypothetical protein